MNTPIPINKEKIRAEYEGLIEKLLDDSIDAKEKIEIVKSINFLTETTFAKYLANSDYVEFNDLREID
ncbi:hypothetical protein [Turicibacter sp.]|uniref:hypothetical protein n=1 Tax=Turicibacter sp. TaxID=2049042 RepID=UPI001B6109BA|nr:hypothetical protein [Turicibacter sp.]MBP3905048.1 hypothetical protein [Turicibacter sp.]MBP3908045.1 hypothetical protein [Turicibacter sp.]